MIHGDHEDLVARIAFSLPHMLIDGQVRGRFLGLLGSQLLAIPRP